MINKTSLKFIGGFVLIIALAMGGLYFLNYYFSPEQKALREFNELERLYAEDTYGGSTPEETLQLFIDALKAGDIDLASRYFLIEDQKSKKGQLSLLKQENIDAFLNDLAKAKIIKTSEESARFEYTRFFGGGNVSLQGKEFEVDAGPINQPVDMVKTQSGIWKISNM